MKSLVFVSGILICAGCAKNSAPVEPTPVPVSVVIPTMAPEPLFSPELNPQDAREISESNLKIMGLAIFLYTEKHGDKFPDMSSAESMQKQAYPFLTSGGKEKFGHPATGSPYSPNPSLSAVDIGTVKDPTGTALAYESEADGNLSRAVLFADGHVKRIDESSWPKLKDYSKIP